MYTPFNQILKAFFFLSIFYNFFILAYAINDPYEIRFEGSPVWQTVNRVQIPTPQGTRFDLTALGSGPAYNYRLTARWRFSEASELRALYAPLALELKGQLGYDVFFQNQSFSGSRDLEALYRFNSYRLTYRYKIFHHSKWFFSLGFTAKIRDAEIRLTQGSLSASRKNTGFVPLLHAYGFYQFSSDLRLLLEIDALAAPQGRAEDLGLLLGWQFFPKVEGWVGYRMVEGGSAGGGSVYNFAWLHYGVLGLGYSF